MIFKWDMIHETAFKRVKKLVETLEYLTPPDITKQFIIWTDASDVARGACLAQTNPNIDNTQYKLSEFWSKKFTQNELNWHVYSKELSALLLTLDHGEYTYKHRHIQQ